MTTLFVQYKLKPGVTHADFETWIKTVDYPNMRGIARVKSFSTYRTDKLLFSDAKPSVDYVEVFDITDMDAFMSQDMPGSVVQMVLGEFMSKVDNPELIIANEVM
jgi:REDY-like protein HapK